MAERVFLGLCALALGLGLVMASRAVPELAGSPPVGDADAIFGEVKRLVGDRAVVGFITDRGLDEAPSLFYAANYALAPTAVVAEHGGIELLAKLKEGYAVVSAILDAERRERSARELRDWAAKEGVRIEIVTLPGGLAVVRSYRT